MPASTLEWAYVGCPKKLWDAGAQPLGMERSEADRLETCPCTC